MKVKSIYYRRKGGAMVIEGKEGGRSMLIWTLPEPEKLLDTIMSKASFFTQEKELKIKEKLERLDKYDQKDKTPTQKIPLININRTELKDANEPEKKKLTQEEINQLWELTK